MTFTCNVCGAVCDADLGALRRETPSCACGSTPRYRSVMHALTVELFGEGTPIPDLPERKDVHGIGLSDWGVYAQQLSKRLGFYTTYLQQEPRLDITEVPERLRGRFDFVISSEVFEHVPPPVSRAFAGARSLLKDDGLLVLTVPYGFQAATLEHFPELHDFTIEGEGDERVLVNVTADGRRQVFDDLAFHGGRGQTLEMRYFAFADVVDQLLAAGFDEIRLHGPVARFGVRWPRAVDLPITARAR